MAKILITDDSKFQRTLLKNYVQKLGHEFEEAKNGDEAIQKFSEYHPDCMILDLLMPGKTGIEVLEELKPAEMNFPVIVLTADIQEGSKQQCIELGAKFFLNKPLNKDKFESIINEALSQ